mmetsp:Transcript_32781/g.57033  ORF Transcript_32781/g.57033 Transcript_32781/m.57033 type:complete len:152 (+) Transcript_32781:52-507(+)
MEPSQKAAFLECVNLSLRNWPAIRLAVSQGWGSEDARQTLVNEVADLIEDRDVEPEFVAELLEEALTERFSVLLDDNSSIEIGRILLKAFNECLEDNFTTLEELRKIDPTSSFTKAPKPADAEISTQASLMRVDDEEDKEGFTIVRKARRS